MSILSRLIARLRSPSGRPRRRQHDVVRTTGEEDFAWLHPPKDLRSAEMWDKYHYQHLSHGLGPALADMFTDDRELVTAMNILKLETVLCAGSGLSLEPLALAAAGFRVTAIDLSASALDVTQRDPTRADFTDTFLERNQIRAGGTVEWVAGDILDLACCPGPFDVIIERRTAQIYPNVAEILTPLIERLSPEGILFTHCHDGAWRPPENPRHRVGEWLKKQGWQFWRGSGSKPAGRVAWLYSTTG